MKFIKTSSLVKVVAGIFLLCLYRSDFFIIESSSNIYFNTFHWQEKGNNRSGLESSVLNEQEATSKKKYFMVIVIPSKPDLIRLRHSMRTKWLNKSCWRDSEFNGVDERYLSFKLMFVVGRSKYLYSHEFSDELESNNDMYLINKIESKQIVKDKVLLGMRESVKLFDYDYFIKIDHDTFVDLPHLVKRIPWLRQENLYTGSCHNRLKRMGKSTISYCQGGAYILSRDVVEKITSLSDDETKVRLGFNEPEDAYTGWLIKQIKIKFNIKGLYPRSNRWIVNRVHLQNYHYYFRGWFHHWIKGWTAMNRAFKCRIKVNLTSCPSNKYFYKSYSTKECSCSPNWSRNRWAYDIFE